MVRLQVADEQRRLARRGYDGRVARVESYLDVVQGWGHVVDIQTEEDRGDQSTLNHPAFMQRRDDMAVWKGASNVRSRRYDESMDYVGREVEDC